MLAEVSVIIKQEGKPAEDQRGTQYQEQSGKDTQDAAEIEIAQGEAVFAQAVEQDAADQKTGDDEENVDADESAFDPGGKVVIADDGKHRDGAQSVDVRAVSNMIMFFCLHFRESQKIIGVIE
jgi:hypothetical protein